MNGFKSAMTMTRVIIQNGNLTSSKKKKMVCFLLEIHHLLNLLLDWESLFLPLLFTDAIEIL